MNMNTYPDLQNADAPSPSSPNNSGKRVVIIFLGSLALIVLAFVALVMTARSTLPQENEIINLEQAAQHVQAGEVERILVQEERDVFLYLAGQTRPLYTRLEPGATITETLTGLGVSVEQLPPIEIDSD
jgi:HAMP domain-containing protein